MKQRYLVGKMNAPEEKEGDPDEVTMESLGEDSCLHKLCYLPNIIYWLLLSSFSPAEMCIKKSLLLFRFGPCGVTCQDSDSFKATGGSSDLLLRSSSISEGDFQASSSLAPQNAGSEEGSEARSGENKSGAQVQHSSSCGHNKQGHTGSTETLSSHPGEPASPSGLPRKPPFSRARLRLLSCRSIEEPRMTPPVKDRYPMLKHILNFIRDQALTTARLLISNLLFNIFYLCYFYHTGLNNWILLPVAFCRPCPWTKRRLWVCVRSWKWFSSVYIHLESHTFSKPPAYCSYRSCWHARKTSPGTLESLLYMWIIKPSTVK